MLTARPRPALHLSCPFSRPPPSTPHLPFYTLYFSRFPCFMSFTQFFSFDLCMMLFVRSSRTVYNCFNSSGQLKYETFFNSRVAFGFHFNFAPDFFLKFHLIMVEFSSSFDSVPFSVANLIDSLERTSSSRSFRSSS